MQGSVSKYATQKGDRWYYVVSNPGGTPKQIKRGGFLTKKQATAAMQARLVARRADDWIEPSTQRLDAYLADWLEDTAPTITAATLLSYRVHVGHLCRAIGHVPLGALTPPLIADAYDAIGQTLSPNTMRITRSVLRAALNRAVRWRLIRTNPAAVVTLPSPHPAERRVWSTDEAERFLKGTADDPHHALWRLLLATGMRISEALALPWSALDLDTGRVAVWRTLAKDEDHAPTIQERTKTKSGRRTLDLEAPVIAALRRHRTRQHEARLACRDWRDLGLVFPGEHGQVRRSDTARQQLARACRMAGVTVLTPHELRHTAATIMVARGVPLHAVMGVLGHASIALTASLYAHHTPEATKNALSILSRVLEGEVG